MALSSGYQIVIVLEARDQASGGIDRVTGSLGGLGSIVGGILAADVIRFLGREISDLASMALSGAAAFQMYQLSFEGLIAREMRAADETLSFADALIVASVRAEGLLGWLQDIAVTTPFTVKDLARTVQLSMAMGFTSEKAKGVTLAVGNFTAGMGLSGEVMERIIYNFGQITQQGKIAGTELRDLARGGFLPITAILTRMRDNLGLSTMTLDAFRKAAGKGKYDVTEFFTAFEQIVAEEFPDAMERMALTWQGVMGNVQDFIQSVLGVDLLGPVVNSFTRRASLALQGFMSPEMRAGFERIGIALGASFDFVMYMLDEELLPALGELFSALGLGLPDAWSIADAILAFGMAAGNAARDAANFIRDVIVPIAEWAKDESILTLFQRFGGLALLIGGAFAVIGGIVIPIITTIGTLLAGPLGIILLIAGAVALLWTAWEQNWGGIRDFITVLWTGTLQPFLLWLQSTMQTGIPAALAAAQPFIDEFTNRFNIAWIEIRDVVLPIIAAVVEWFQVMIPQAMAQAGPAFQTAQTFIAALTPILQGIWDVVMALFTAITSLLAPVIKFLGSVFTNVLLPVLQIVSGYFTNVLHPIVIAVAGVIGAILGKALSALAGLLQKVVVPALLAVFGWINDKVGPALKWLKEKMLDPLAKTLSTVATWVQDVVRWLGKLATSIREIKLPSWLTPGSPTPFELGIRGIAEAMRDLNAVPFMQMRGAGAAGSTSTSTEYKITAQYPYRPEATLLNDMRLLQLLQGGAR